MSAPQKVRFRTGMGCLGIFFSAFPVFPLIIAFEYSRREGWLPFAIVASICVPLLLTFLFGRKGVTLDVARRKVVRWWGLWLFGLELPIAAKEEELNPTEALLDVVWRTAKNSSYRVITLSLGPDSRRVPLAEFSTYLKARGQAERVANALGLPLRDATPGDGRTKRDAGTLDLPLRDRLRQSGAPPEAPAPPEPATVVRDELDGEIFFEMPKDVPRAMRKMRAVLSILGLLAAILLAELAVEPVIGAPLVWSVGVTVGVLTMIAVCTVAGASERVRLYVSGSGIRRESASWVHLRSSRIDAARIEEVTVGATRLGRTETVVAAWGDEDLIEFGAALPLKDLEWIRNEILYRLGRG